MLNTSTKKRIDDCRDILVGKLPDPKAQIEQITIALIYKFMDDMDKEAVELGGKPKFFADYTIPDPENPKKKKKIEFEKFAWDNLFDPKVSASQILALYAEAITLMDKNPNIPQLFRDIFKNAFLPYRDPETLKLFLKEIGKFEYTHSEKLGDAFEYLLAVMGSQGDAGQFRTPRHIIDFLVSVVDPDIKDTILDPACGTAGFLISAYKHIRLKHSKANKDKLNIYQYDNNYADTEKPFNSLGDTITPDDRKRLIKNISGYDISPDMVRLSLVNLYLHGFSDPHIYEYDTLSRDDRWKESFDVILANPPFMSPKGGIKPLDKFSINSNRSEVLFVDYIAEHLNPKGRAGIIVPEGIIFQSGTAYKALRKMLVENYLYAVVSLPAGVFNPYSGVKTSILLMDKEFVKTSDEILFVKIDNDGYSLGAQRNAVKGSQLEEAIEIIKSFRDGSYANAESEHSGSLAHAVPKVEIAKNGDYNLSGERYKVLDNKNFHYPSKKVGEVCTINPLKSELTDLTQATIVSFVPMADLNENKMYFEPKQSKPLSEVYNGYTYFADNDVIIAKVTPCFENGKAGLATNLSNGIGFGSSEFYVLRSENSILPQYLYYVIKNSKFYEYAIPKMTGTGGLRRVPKNVLSDFQIPLPPLSVQQEIVAEIEEYQKIIDGAKMVVENYKPRIDIDPEWEMVELGSLCSIKHGFAFKSEDFIADGNSNLPIVLAPGNYNEAGGLTFTTKNTRRFQGLVDKEYLFREGDLTIVMTDLSPMMKILGNPAIIESKNILHNQRIGKFIFKSNLIQPKYLYYSLFLPSIKNRIKQTATGTLIRHTSPDRILECVIPLPPLKTQRQIVSQIEQEQQLVNANKQLIELFEKKVKERIAKVWGE